MHFRTDTNLIVVFCVVSFVRNIGMTSIILFDSAIHAPICLHRSSLLVYVTVTVAESFPLAVNIYTITRILFVVSYFLYNTRIKYFLVLIRASVDKISVAGHSRNVCEKKSGLVQYINYKYKFLLIDSKRKSSKKIFLTSLLFYKSVFLSVVE